LLRRSFKIAAPAVAATATAAIVLRDESRRFYEAAAQRTKDAGIRQLLDDLAEEEQRGEAVASKSRCQTTSGALSHERDLARRLLVLRFIQPGLAGLMDRSVSTLRDREVEKPHHHLPTICEPRRRRAVRRQVDHRHRHVRRRRS